ncbi:XRE family transcriptional regulator [Myxococcota bacterium]|nr:XRE family transcriptional regulator [Myxococcota bacterium]
MDDDLKRIAARIRTWRNEGRLTLQQLGDRSGVSASTIHKIENLQTVPTIAVLLKVAHGLSRRPSELLAEIEAGEQVAIVRRDDRLRAQLGDGGQIEHLIGAIPRSRLDVWRIRLEPGIGVGMPGTEPWQFQGEIALIVEEGTIEAVIGEETYELARGDSMHYDPNVPHRWFATGGKPALVLVTAILPERIHSELTTRIARSVLDAEDPYCLNA